MALKVNPKVGKGLKPNKASTKPDLEADEVSEATEVVAEDVVTEDAPTADGAEEKAEKTSKVTTTESLHSNKNIPVAQAAPVATVSAKDPTKKGWVIFSCTREINPPPVVGHFNVQHELSITKMVAGQNYTLPLHVAQQLADSKAGMVFNNQ